ncbi:hypothetical protein [Evansella halocellulosilytica]|uniref:hypothetical protein n=1 Tax=Evansella halocellulosilytica TaxID=2011013 RepID=UPI00211C958C|nr:hypothetical protein [Evansella halocellulosilytica]
MIKEMIYTIIENNQHMIIEGCYLLPEKIKELKDTYPDRIISMFLGFSTDYIQNHFTSHVIKHRNVIETRNYPEERHVTQFIREHDENKQRCLKSDVAYCEIDRNYEEEIKAGYDYIHNRLTKMNTL